jgi:hypothetical protein
VASHLVARWLQASDFKSEVVDIAYRVKRKGLPSDIVLCVDDFVNDAVCDSSPKTCRVSRRIPAAGRADGQAFPPP